MACGSQCEMIFWSHAGPSLSPPEFFLLLWINKHSEHGYCQDIAVKEIVSDQDELFIPRSLQISEWDLKARPVRQVLLPGLPVLRAELRVWPTGALPSRVCSLEQSGKRQVEGGTGLKTILLVFGCTRCPPSWAVTMGKAVLSNARDNVESFTCM